MQLEFGNADHIKMARDYEASANAPPPEQIPAWSRREVEMELLRKELDELRSEREDIERQEMAARDRLRDLKRENEGETPVGLCVCGQIHEEAAR